MAGVKISALPVVASALITDFFPAVQGGTTSKETLLQVRTLFGFDSVTGVLPLSLGGTGAAITASANSLVVSGASSLSLLASGNNGVLVTSAGGVPSISTTLPAGLTITGYARSGANSDITSLTGLTGTLRAPTGITSSAGVALLAFGYTASAVNYLSIVNNVTGQSPVIDSNGSDASVAMTLRPKNGNLNIIDNSSTIAPAIRYYNAAGNHFTGLKVATAAASDVTFVLPSADTAGFMISDGSANLSLFGTPVDISGSVTVNGFSAIALATFTQLRIGKMVFIRYIITGTSNANSFTVTNLPVAAQTNQWFSILVTDNGTNTFGIAGVSGTTITFAPNAATNNTVWTTSGTKNAFGSFWYEAS